MVTLEERLRHLRKEKRLSQQDLADLVDKTKRTIQRWESEKDDAEPSRGELLVIEEATGFRSEWLRTGEGAMLVRSSSDETDPDATGDAALVIYHPDGTPWLTVSAADLFKNARVVNPMRMGADLKRAKLKVEREFTPDTTEVPKTIE